MHQTTLLRILLQARLDRARRNEAGASAVEWVVITALLITIAVAVGAIILTKLKGAASNLNP